jgi:hypothetical protein
MPPGEVRQNVRCGQLEVLALCPVARGGLPTPGPACGEIVDPGATLHL